MVLSAPLSGTILYPEHLVFALCHPLAMVSALEIVGGAAALLVALVVAGYLAGAYNSLVRLQKKCEKASRNVDVKLKQRQDTLRKLIDAVREYLEHEEEVLSKLVEARERAERASSPREQAEADAKVREAMAAFNARAEDHPELRSAENMRQLQEEIARLEEEISDRREFYNDSVTLYNTRIRQLPYLLFAGAMGYSERELFEASGEELADVDVGAGLSSDESTATGQSEPAPEA